MASNHASPVASPQQVSEVEDSDKEQYSGEQYSICDYDLDVVDAALLNPDSSEFRDHFGFRIQVRTDDEDSSESEDDQSESEDNDKEVKAQPKSRKPKASTTTTAVNAAANETRPSSYEHTASSPSDDNTECSVDTALTTPTSARQMNALSTNAIQGAGKQPRRGRAQTISRTPVPIIPSQTALDAPPGRRKRAMTVSRPMMATPKESVDLISEILPPAEEDVEIIDIDPSTEPSAHSAPNGARPHQDAPSRPSQIYQDRQNKRLSELFKGTPVRTEGKQAVRTSLSSISSTSSGGANFYDMLVSKFGRSSQEQPQQSPKQEALKAETSHNLEILKEASNEQYDWDFWATVISDADTALRTDKSSLQNQLCAGIPPQLRGMMWQLFSKSRTNSETIEMEYRELLKRTSPHEKVIRRDLARTFPTHAFFKDRGGDGQEMLFNVIKAYSIFDQQVGYCQGLPFVVGCLLLHMPDEAAFCVLIKLMGQYNLRGHFTPQMETLHERLFQFEKLLREKLPQVYRHLDAQGVRPTMYASQWFMTLFAYRGPLDLVFRVFDLVFVEGSHILLNFALALVKANQQTLLSLEFEALIEFFSNDIYNVYKDDASRFVRDAYSFDISTRQLSKWAKQHATEAAKEAKIQSEEDTLRRRNTELTNQLKRLETSYKELDKEHQEIARHVIETKMSMARMDSENQELKRQISVMRADMDRAQSTMNEDQQTQFEEVAKENARLVQQNSHLEDQLASIEAILIDLKMKYAESENEYEQMKRRLQEAHKFCV